MDKEMITVYHGTTKDFGEQILKDGVIKAHRKPNKSDAYVFVSSDEKIATAYSIQDAQLENDSTIPGRLSEYTIYVYELSIPEEELEANDSTHDEFINKTYYKLKQDISLEKYGVKLLKRHVANENDELDPRLIELSETVTKNNPSYFEEKDTRLFDETIDLNE